jgi:hypothetical protein
MYGVNKKVIYFCSKTKAMHQFLKFILFCSSTLHVSDGLSVHHQESKTVRTASYQTDSADCLLAGTKWNCSSISSPLASSQQNLFLTYSWCCRRKLALIELRSSQQLHKMVCNVCEFYKLWHICSTHRIGRQLRRE